MFSLLLLIPGILLFLLATGAAVVSHHEGESRAARVIFALGLLLGAPYMAVACTDFAGRSAVVGLLLALPVLVVLPFAWRRQHPAEDQVPSRRIDERDIMFARSRLEPGTGRFDEYYTRKPEKRYWDDRFRTRPGLLKEGSSCYDRRLFSAALASMETVARFHPFVEPKPVPEQAQVDPAGITRFIKQWGRKLGAVSIGITRLKECHFYSHIGRQEPYGSPIQPEHRFGIALAVEMDRNMLRHAPLGPTIMESAQQYLNAGAIAVQIADFCSRLGYAARAHIDGNYRVICPLVARDAGLGEIGRMGLLMTPRFGPRVRLSVVTTDLPLEADPRRQDPSTIDFCTHCRKCATACPARAIPTGERTEIDGARRWQINSEACFTYWCSTGTDCGRCIYVCPYSHPDNLLHNVVRLAVRRSGLFRRAAILMDDILYGKKPPVHKLPDWMA